MGRRKSKGKPNPQQLHIYCEGESEKLYLDNIRKLIGTKKRQKLVVKSERKQGMTLFNYVKNRYKNHDYKVTPVNIVLVIDKDDTPINELEHLKKKCLEEGYLLVYSNACFELWLLLHFEKVNHFTTRDSLRNMLSTKLGKKYKKTNESIFEQIVKNYNTAMINSKDMIDSIPDFKKNPYTNMGELLNKYFNVN